MLLEDDAHADTRAGIANGTGESKSHANPLGADGSSYG